MFDVTSFEVGGVSLIALVFGLTQFTKEMLNWEGKKVTAIATFYGVLLFAVFQAIQYLPSPYLEIVTAVYTSAAFGLAASGFYKFGTRNE